MVSFQVSAEKVNVDLEDQTAILTGVDLSSLVAEIGAISILQEIALETIMEFVSDELKERAGNE